MKWLAVDPGESVGWSLWEDAQLMEAGTSNLWGFGDAVFIAAIRPEEAELIDDPLANSFIGVEKIVCEDFRIYPWKAHDGSLDWDPVRTARLIGALTQICRMGGLDFVLQPAKIKERAEAAGATALFSFPLDENRHQNDSIRHATYHLAVKNGAAPILSDEYREFLDHIHDEQDHPQVAPTNQERNDEEKEEKRSRTKSTNRRRTKNTAKNS